MPLIDLPALAGSLGIRNLRYKQDGRGFGLGSVKSLGGAYAVLQTVQRELSKSIDKLADPAGIRWGLPALSTKTKTVVSATDGNYGRSVAWGAAQFHTNRRIYIDAEVSENRAEVMRKLGTEGGYGVTVAHIRADAERNRWLIASETSWPG